MLAEQVLLQPIERSFARVEEGLRVLADLGVLRAIGAQMARVQAVDAGAHGERNRPVAGAQQRNEVGPSQVAGKRRAVCQV